MVPFENAALLPGGAPCKSAELDCGILDPDAVNFQSSRCASDLQGATSCPCLVAVMQTACWHQCLGVPDDITLEGQRDQV